MSRYDELAQEFEIITGRAMETGTLEKRIIIQKIAYLLFRKGAESNYTDFSWYLHGVFSWDLWYDVIHKWDVLPQSLPDEKTALLNTISQVFRRAGLDSYFDTADNLELITTILYCVQQGREDIREDNSVLINNVIALKRKFTQEGIKDAILKIGLVSWNFPSQF